MARVTRDATARQMTKIVEIAVRLHAIRVDRQRSEEKDERLRIQIEQLVTERAALVTHMAKCGDEEARLLTALDAVMSRVDRDSGD